MRLFYHSPIKLLLKFYSFVAQDNLSPNEAEFIYFCKKIILRLISYLYFKISGWKVQGEIPSDIKKAVIIAAPHTSSLDFIIGRLGFYLLGVRKVKFLIKKEMFYFPLGTIIRAMGAMPVDRERKGNLAAEQVIKMFAKNESFFLLVTPEGTRKYTTHWKKGFYFIALKAKVPIVVGFLDYNKKECGFDHILYPSGDFEKDFKTITEFYKTKTARHPKNFNLSEIYQKKETSSYN